MNHSLELLEARIAPAALSGKVLSYTDLDGDHVTVTFTKGAPAASNFTFSTGSVNGDSTTPQQLQLIDIHGSAGQGFDGTDVTVKVIRHGLGDGTAAIGAINAAGIHLGKVSINGDLGAVTADGSGNQPAIAALTVRSLGAYDLRTQAAGGSMVSDLTNGLGPVRVLGSVSHAFLKVTGSITSVSIGGSLVGGTDPDSGSIVANGNIGPVFLGGDLTGGTAARSGYLHAGGSLGAVTVRGSVIGGTQMQTGRIEAGAGIGRITVGHDIVGGSGTDSGYIESTGGPITGLVVFGSVLGGAANDSGCVAVSGGGVTGAGGVGFVYIGGDLAGGAGVVSGYVGAAVNIGPVYIGGSIIGGAAAQTGGLIAHGSMGRVTIGHDLHGGGGSQAGYVEADGTLAGIAIGGSVLGGTQSETGEIRAFGPLGPVRIGHNVVGGAGSVSGIISGGSTMASVTIFGSLIGGAGDDSGEIITSGPQAGVETNLGPVFIGHDLVGGSIAGTTASLTDSGCIISDGQIKSVIVGGSIFAGTDTSTASGATLSGSGTIRADYDIPLLRVGGSIVGHVTAKGDSFVEISAGGQETVPANPRSDQAFGSITVGGRVEGTLILGGYDTSLSFHDGQAQIGAVRVGGDWIASSLVAGVQNSGGITQFGANNGANDSVPSPSIAKIASIQIAGYVIGDAGSTNGTDHFAFASAHIGPVAIGGALVPSTVGVTSLSPLTGDVVIHRFA